MSGTLHDFASMSVRAFTAALAGRTPAPGGGAVAALTAANAAALVSMVVEFSRGKNSFALFEGEADAILASLDVTREACLAAAKADSDAYASLSALWKLPKDDPARIARWKSTVHAAIAAPQLIVALAAEIAGRCRVLAGSTAKQLDSDLAIAADLAGCAARAAAWNVRVNLPSVADDEERTVIARALDRSLHVIDDDIKMTHGVIERR
ncbi:MAG: cyclodeaminase/cyclohydrolase family protein [Phycisphaerae bacterium]|nr:cyclodeaminase/cyclohydrolase family protein [Phycisphaerae bacterium]